MPQTRTHSVTTHILSHGIFPDFYIRSFSFQISLLFLFHVIWSRQISHAVKPIRRIFAMMRCSQTGFVRTHIFIGFYVRRDILRFILCVLFFRFVLFSKSAFLFVPRVFYSVRSSVVHHIANASLNEHEIWIETSSQYIVIVCDCDTTYVCLCLCLCIGERTSETMFNSSLLNRKLSRWRWCSWWSCNTISDLTIHGCRSCMEFFGFSFFSCHCPRNAYVFS